jgi:hypothetical protein
MTNKVTSIFRGNNVIVLIIILVAAILRFYRLSEIPFTFDELSAINRTTYDSFSELLSKGIYNDGHPAGIQIFLYYLTHFFGYSQIVVKLPFLIAGMVSVWLVYIIAKKWFNETTGLLSSAFVASIQFTIMYSQIARPYASGLFFLLFFIYFWTRIVIEKHDRLFCWIGFSIAAALCAYNHYFSLFSAAVAALTGLFIVTPSLRKKYIIYSGLAILLFLPHISISIHQFSLGGLNWLPVTDSSFFSLFGGFILHHSWWLITFFIGLVLTGIILHFRKGIKPRFKSLRWIGIVWFFLPLITGYMYSVFEKPVLQISVLIFSLPFLFITAFSFFPPLKTKVNVLLVLMVFCFTIPTLIFNRQYYNVFYNQGYDGIAKNQIALLDSLKQPISLLVNGYEPLFLQYYSLKYNHEIPCNLYSFDTYNSEQFTRYVKKIKTDYIAVAHVGVMPLHYFDLAQNEFPYFVKKATGLCYEWYVFSKIPQGNKSQYFLEIKNSFEKPCKGWKWGQNNIYEEPMDTTNACYQFKKGDEWGPNFNTTLSELKCSKHDLIHFSVNILPDSICDVSLVVSMTDSKDSAFYWNSVSQSDYFGIPNRWKKLNMTIRLTDVKLPDDSIFVHAYIWNKSKSILYIDNFDVKVEKGNPFIYAVFVDF